MMKNALWLDRQVESRSVMPFDARKKPSGPPWVHLRPECGIFPNHWIVLSLHGYLMHTCIW